MNTQTSAPAKTSEKNQKMKPASDQKSASKRADEQAKRGEPLSVESPRDRSPKQENL